MFQVPSDYPYKLQLQAECVNFYVDKKMILSNVSACLAAYLWVGSFYIYNIEVPIKIKKTFESLKHYFFKSPMDPKLSLNQLKLRYPRQEIQ